MNDTTPAGDDRRWLALAEPFPADQIEKLPKPFNRDSDKGTCNRPDRNGYFCGGYHALPAIHLDYVGHAGVTMRLNSVDTSWSWEAMYREVPPELMKAAIESGQGDIVSQLIRNSPMRFSDGGLWINLTVLGVTRPGFGDAGGKKGPNAVKELIGDAIRNAAMRFGVGTYLWSKSEAAAAMTQREDGVDVEAGEATAAPRSGVPQQRRPASRRTARPEPAIQPEPSEADGPSEAAVMAARKLALTAAAENNHPRLQQLYRSAGSVLLRIDVTSALTPQQRAFTQQTVPVKLGTWLVVCGSHAQSTGDSIDTSINLDPANQEAPAR